MSKYNTIDIWNKIYGNKESVTDYADRIIKNRLVVIQIANFIRR